MPLATVEEERGERASILSSDRYLFAFFLRVGLPQALGWEGCFNTTGLRPTVMEAGIGGQGNQPNPPLWNNNPVYQPPPPGLEAGDQRPNLGLGAQPVRPNNAVLNRDQVNDLIQQQLVPHMRRPNRPTYRRPYPDWIDTAYALPRGYKVPDFAKFSGETNQSTVEHIGRFTVQCGEAGANDFLKMRLFANSLSDTAFEWYINLPANSIQTWQQMEEAFHSQFYRIAPEVSITDLSGMYQIAGEKVEDFIARFKRARHRCPLVLPEPEFVKLAQNGLEFELRKKFVGMDFRDLFELATAAAR
ncbi:hypothetical protein NE237_025370 [Protea cynaroides]|uniref:Retrotransposon gag domain-containing protein n=1 Tax=Protea cynaroides TaxID=273540 RepID=A0A9Q0H304_9MAGN|nr:hypothetical protein NE237_025370 [Protea cynaroides]